MSSDDPLYPLKVAVWSRRILGNYSSDPRTMDDGSEDTAKALKKMTFEVLCAEAQRSITSWATSGHPVIHAPLPNSVAALMSINLDTCGSWAHVKAYLGI